MEVYSDKLLVWQHSVETEVLPELVDKHYIERDFATLEEVAHILDVADPDDVLMIAIDDTPTDNSSNLVKSGGVKTYVDEAIAVLEARISALEQR